MRKNYFLDSKYFLAFANLGFIVLLLDNLFSQLWNVPSSTTALVVLIGAMATCVGFASYLLERNVGGTGFHELAEFLRHPPRSFKAYIGIILAWVISSLILYPFQLHQQPGPEGLEYYFTFEPWWLASTAILLCSFFAGPVYTLYRQSRKIKDLKVVHSIRILVLSWTGFAAMEFIRGTAGQYSPFVQNIGSLVDSFLFVLISLALREPTLLGRIMSGVQVGGQAFYSVDADTIVLYSLDSDRRKLVDVFTRDSVGSDMVIYTPKADVPLYTALLRGSSAASASHKPVEVQPVEATLTVGPEAVLHPGFSRSKRELIDLGELNSTTCRQVLTRVRELDELPGPSRKGRVWALKVEARGSELVDEIRLSSINPRVIDFAGHQKSFSKLVGIEHSQLLSSRILLEYEPSSDFEDVVLKFVLEFQANVDPVAVFTSAGSPVYLRAKDHHNIRMFTSSTKTSNPLKISENEVLLPERDTSLFLDAVDKLLQANHGRPVGIAFDNLTDLIISQGFDKAYGVLSSISEMSETEGATLLLLVNREALDETVLNGIRGLFRFQVSYDAEGLKPVRIPEVGVRRIEGSDSLKTSPRVLSARLAP